MLTDEQKARLNPEQLAIAEGWERDADERSDWLDKMVAASEAKDWEAHQKALDGYLSVGKDKTHCAHERSLMSNCMACTEICQLLNPEYFCSKCGDPFEEDELNLVQGICDYCSQGESDE